MGKDPDETGLGFDGDDGDASGKTGGKNKWIIIAIIGIAAIVAISLLVARRDTTPKLSIEDVNTELQSLLVSYNKTTARLTNTRTTVATHTEDISDINKDLGEMQDKVDALADPVNYQPQINSLNTRLASLNATISACNCSANVTCNYTDWQPKIDELIADIAALNATINEWEVPEVDIPYALVTYAGGTHVSFKVYGTDDAPVIVTIIGDGLDTIYEVEDVATEVYSSSNEMNISLTPLDKWEEGGIINIITNNGTVAFAYAMIGA